MMKKFLLSFVLFSISFIGFSQITGVVYDKDGISLPGVSISIEGTTKGTTTNMDGYYEIDAQTNDVLVFQFVGFLTQKVLVKNKSEINIYLAPDIVNLDEVVVLGYSNKARNEIASAVSVVDADDLMDVTTNDVGSMLQGKVAGVQVVNTSGEPGATAQIRIRGISTIKPGNNEPLYVVDGIIGGEFDPNDVENITVLKDAGATGMYGARASKGVIIVTTKKAAMGKTQFEFNSSIGYKVADQGNVTMMNGQQFYTLSQELYRDPETHEIDKIKFYDMYPRELENRNFNWVDEAFSAGLVQKYYLSASGTKDKFSYYVSGAYYNEDGTFRKTSYENINLRANTTYKFNDWASMRNNINISSSKGQYYDYMDMYYSYLSLPWDDAYDEHGNPRYVDGRTDGWWSRDNINPFHTIDNSDHTSKGFNVNYDLALDFKITHWLTFTTSNRVSAYTEKSHNFVSPIAAGPYHDKGVVSEMQNLSYDGITTNLFRFNFDFGKHSISGLLGGEFQGGRFEFLSVEGKGLPEGFDVPAVAANEVQIDGSYTNAYFQSFISQINYNFDKRYFLTASYRIDESSNFPSGNRVAQFPTISGSWLAKNEAFLRDSEVMSNLKVRASWGITGDPDIGASRYMGLFSLNTQYNGEPGATPYQLQNTGLTWEKTNELNFGIDIGFINRINLTLDVYNNVTTDLIVLAAQPLSQGFEYRWENNGTLTNKGIEIALSTINVKTTSFEWGMDIIFAANDNMLSGIDVPFFTTVSGVSQIYRNDVSIYTFILPKWLGVDEQTGAPVWEKLTKDENGNIISREPTSNYAEATPQEVGNALPKFQGGFNTYFSFKGFSLYLSFAYQYGNDVYNFTRRFMDHDGHEPYYNYMVLKDDWSIWEKPGDQATHPSWQNAELSRENSSRYLEDGSFLKLRNVSLRYDFPKRWVSPALQGLALSFRADNLWTWTNFWGQDPEVTLNQADWSMPGVSDFRYPNSKQFVFNIEVKF